MTYLPIDSHCHLHSIPYDRIGIDMDTLIHNCFHGENPLEAMLSVCIEVSDLPSLYAISEKHPRISISAGQHPTDVEHTSLAQLEEVLSEALLRQDVVAVGETGLDYFHPHDKKTQEAFFRLQIQLAKHYKKPLIIHSRDAREDTIRILKEEKAEDIGGVFHCFTESYDMAKKGLDLGFLISFSGIVTFKNAKEVQDVATKIPLSSMLIETDAPYLAPMPFRGKVNQPTYVNFVAEKIAELKSTSKEEVCKVTSENFYRLFFNK